MRFFTLSAICSLIVFSFVAPAIAQEAEEHVHASTVSEEGLGRAHMDISCSPVAAKFDHALALLHNFWYARALEAPAAWFCRAAGVALLAGSLAIGADQTALAHATYRHRVHLPIGLRIELRSGIVAEARKVDDSVHTV